MENRFFSLHFLRLPQRLNWIRAWDYGARGGCTFASRAWFFYNAFLSTSPGPRIWLFIWKKAAKNCACESDPLFFYFDACEKFRVTRNNPIRDDEYSVIDWRGKNWPIGKKIELKLKFHE